MDERAPKTESTPRNYASSIGDIVKVGRKGSTFHRPDGKFLSRHELDTIQEHADLIRGDLPSDGSKEFPLEPLNLEDIERGVEEAVETGDLSAIRERMNEITAQIRERYNPVDWPGENEALLELSGRLFRAAHSNEEGVLAGSGAGALHASTASGGPEPDFIPLAFGKERESLSARFSRIKREMGAKASSIFFTLRFNPEETASDEAIGEYDPDLGYIPLSPAKKEKEKLHKRLAGLLKNDQKEPVLAGAALPEKNKIDRKKTLRRVLGSATIALSMFVATDALTSNNKDIDQDSLATPVFDTSVSWNGSNGSESDPIYISSEMATPVPSSTPSATPVETIESTMASPIAPTAAMVETKDSVATPPAGDDDSQNEIIEQQSPTPITTPENTEGSNVAPAPLDNSESIPAGEPSQNDTEYTANTVEALMVSVEVDPGDGVTQVLAKVLAQAGYLNVSPDQLFKIYEELVTDPGVGPDAILNIPLEYNAATGEYWILGEGGAEAHLTQAAAERIQQSAILN